MGETGYMEWLDLDRVLVQLWESRSTRLEIGHNGVTEDEKKDAINCVRCLLPERTKRGGIYLVGCVRWAQGIRS